MSIHVPAWRMISTTYNVSRSWTFLWSRMIVVTRSYFFGNRFDIIENITLKLFFASFHLLRFWIIFQIECCTSQLLSIEKCCKIWFSQYIQFSAIAVHCRIESFQEATEGAICFFYTTRRQVVKKVQLTAGALKIIRNKYSLESDDYSKPWRCAFLQQGYRTKIIENYLVAHSNIAYETLLDTEIIPMSHIIIIQHCFSHKVFQIRLFRQSLIRLRSNCFVSEFTLVSELSSFTRGHESKSNKFLHDMITEQGWKWFRSEIKIQNRFYRNCID